MSVLPCGSNFNEKYCKYCDYYKDCKDKKDVVTKEEYIKLKGGSN